MSRRGLPAPGEQACPRAVRLADGTFLPASMLRILLARSGRLELLQTGRALEPAIRDGAKLRVEPCAAPRRGDILLCDAGGAGDLRRCLGVMPDGGAVTALDVIPGGRERVAASRILGAVRGAAGAGDRRGRLIARLFPLWSRCAAARLQLRRTGEIPAGPADAAAESVRGKYQGQVAGYSADVDLALPEELLALLRRELPPQARLLVAGCGAGNEAIRLARLGYRVGAFDFVPEMIEAARENARAAGAAVDFFTADLVALEPGGERCDAVYITPLVYSFIPGRTRRIESLRRLGRRLEPGGRIIFTARLYRGPGEWLRGWAVRLLQLARGARGAERGDWQVRFLTPDGAVGGAFCRLFTPGEVMREARAAGCRCVRRSGIYWLAEASGEPAPG